GQSDVEPLPEVGDAGLGVLVLLLRGLERILKGSELPPQRNDLLVEESDLRQGPQRRLLFALKVLAQGPELGLGGGCSGAGALGNPPEAVALATHSREPRLERRHRVIEPRS